MVRRRCCALLLLIAVSIAAPSARAQVEPPRDPPPANPPQRREHSEKEVAGRVWRLTKLIGADVRNAKEEKIGVIKDLVIDEGQGRVVYGVLSFGGFLGVGDKLFAVPWSAFQPAFSADRRLVLDVPKEKLARAPGFDKKSWPDMADRRWNSDVHGWYGRPSYWDSGREKREPARPEDQKR